MRKVSLLVSAGFAAACFVGGYALHGPSAHATPIDPDTAPQIARSFAPWIRAMIQQRPTVADQIFVTPKYIYAAFESDTGKKILARFNGVQQHDLNLIGAKNLGRNTGVLLFTISTEDGPIALKIYYYGYNARLHVSRVELADDWPDIERLDLEMDALTEPTTIPLMGQADE